MKRMTDATSQINSQALVEQFEAVLVFVQSAFDEGGTAHEVEQGLWERMLKLGHDVFQGWLDLFGAGDVEERLGLDDGCAARRLADLHRREIRHVFALFELRRAVYGSRAGQAIEAVPLDERLRLPPGKNSYLLQDGDQEMAMEKPFVHVSTCLSRILGFRQSVHTLERAQHAMAKAVEALWAQRPVPPAEQEGKILVCTADGKAVPRRGTATTPEGAAPPTTGGRRPGTKKMARLGSV
jgi:hypothetical protein